MITLRYKDYDTSVRLSYVLPVDSRENLYEAIKILEVKRCSQLHKLSLCKLLEHLLLGDTIVRVLSYIPQEELDIVWELVDAGPNSHIEVPMREKYLTLQKLFMVLTYEDTDNNTWHLVMPDEIRKNIEKHCAVGVCELGDITENSRSEVDEWCKKAVERLNEDATLSKESILSFPKLLLLHMIGYNKRLPLLDVNKSDLRLDFLPCITRNSDLFGTQTFTHRILTYGAVQVVMKTKEGCFNCYLMHDSRNCISIISCLGAVIREATRTEMFRYNVMHAGLLPKSSNKEYPLIDRLLNVRDNSKPHLMTASYNKQPEQDFICKNFKDVDSKIWDDILLYDIFPKELKDAIREVYSNLVEIISEVRRSRYSVVKDTINDY